MNNAIEMFESEKHFADSHGVSMIREETKNGGGTRRRKGPNA